MRQLKLKVLETRFSIHKLPPNQDIPSAVIESPFYWAAKTDEELSIVCDAELILPGSKVSEDWSCFKIIGPIDFSETGILAGISAVLAEAQISIFAISTFDTDYFLVKSAKLKAARRALSTGGYELEQH